METSAEILAQGNEDQMIWTFYIPESDIAQSNVEDKVDNGYKQLAYDLIGAGYSGIYTHPQEQMDLLGYKVIAGVPQTLGDCWWFTVEDFIEPLPSYLRKMQYDFDYWHGKRP